MEALKDNDAKVRAYAAWSLIEHGDQRALNPLLKALADEATPVRAYAAAALGNLGDSAALEPLTQALRDSASEVRYNAALALGQLGSDPCLSVLFYLAITDTGLNSEGEKVSDAAVRAIRKITNRTRNTSEAD